MLLEDEGVEPFRLPPHSPNMNAFMERFFRSLKSESGATDVIRFDQLIALSLMVAFAVIVLSPRQIIHFKHGEVECGERLGGMLRNYHRAA